MTKWVCSTHVLHKRFLMLMGRKEKGEKRQSTWSYYASYHSKPWPKPWHKGGERKNFARVTGGMEDIADFTVPLRSTCTLALTIAEILHRHMHGNKVTFLQLNRQFLLSLFEMEPSCNSIYEILWLDYCYMPSANMPSTSIFQALAKSSMSKKSILPYQRW